MQTNEHMFCVWSFVLFAHSTQFSEIDLIYLFIIYRIGSWTVLAIIFIGILSLHSIYYVCGKRISKEKKTYYEPIARSKIYLKENQTNINEVDAKIGIRMLKVCLGSIRSVFAYWDNWHFECIVWNEQIVSTHKQTYRKSHIYTLFVDLSDLISLCVINIDFNFIYLWTTTKAKRMFSNRILQCIGCEYERIQLKLHRTFDLILVILHVH